MRIDRLLEASVYVEDMARAVEFYECVLGFRGLAKSAEPYRLTALDIGGKQVLLLCKKGASTEGVDTPGGRIPPFDGSGTGHLAFPIPASDLQPWEKHLADHGVVIESKVNWERGGQSLYFRDPDGNLLELVTPGLWATY